jgi:hypothetical protein
MDEREVRCARCAGVIEHRPDQPMDWLAEDDGEEDALAGLICPNCWTPKERAIAERHSSRGPAEPST